MSQSKPEGIIVRCIHHATYSALSRFVTATA